MFKNILQTINGIEIFPIIGLILFVSFFIWTIIMIFRMDKRFIRYMEEMPLEDTNSNSGGTTCQH